MSNLPFIGKVKPKKKTRHLQGGRLGHFGFVAAILVISWIVFVFGSPSLKALTIAVGLFLALRIFEDSIFAIYKGYAEELNHLSRALMSDSELRDMRCQGRLYGLISAELMCKRIEIGMTAKSLEEKLLKLASSDSELLDKCRFFSPEMMNSSVWFAGYGCGIPTPRIYIDFENGKISNIERGTDYWPWNFLHY